MERAGEHRRERAADLVQIAEGQVGAVQLAVVQARADEIANQRVDLLRVGVGHGAGRGLDAVGQHDHRRLAGLRAGALIAEGGDVDGISVELLRLVVEVDRRRVAVMLADDVDHRLRNARLLRHLRAVAGMSGQNGRRDAGIGAVVGVVPHLVFLEVHGPLELADVVIIRADAGQQAVGADGRAARLGQIGHDDGMVIGARCLQQKPSQQGLVRVGQLDELRRRGQIEQPLQQRLNADAQHGAERAAARRPQGVDQHALHLGAAEQAHGQRDEEVAHGDAQARQQRGGSQHAPGKQHGDHRPAGHGHEHYGVRCAARGDERARQQRQHGVDEQRQTHVHQQRHQQKAQRHRREIDVNLAKARADGRGQNHYDAQQQHLLGAGEQPAMEAPQIEPHGRHGQQHQHGHAGEELHIEAVFGQQTQR